LKFIKTQSLGYVILDEELKPISKFTTPEDEVVGNLQDYLNMWREYAEKIVLSASADRIARMEEVSYSLNPIYTILVYLEETGSIKLEHFETGVSNDDRKTHRYLSLLEGLDIIRKHERGYAAGNLYVSLRESTNDIEKIKLAVFSVILRKRYSFLKDVLSNQTLERIIRLGNVMFYPELEMRSAVLRDYRTLQREYYLEYEVEMLKPDMITYLHKLKKVDIVERKGSFYSGNDSLRNEMYKWLSTMASPEAAWSIPTPI